MLHVHLPDTNLPIRPNVQRQNVCGNAIVLKLIKHDPQAIQNCDAQFCGLFFYDEGHLVEVTVRIYRGLSEKLF